MVDGAVREGFEREAEPLLGPVHCPYMQPPSPPSRRRLSTGPFTSSVPRQRVGVARDFIWRSGTIVSVVEEDEQ
eukprot:6196590-Pleurochrysis_carterae.AAC.2